MYCRHISKSMYIQCFAFLNSHILRKTVIYDNPEIILGVTLNWIILLSNRFSWKLPAVNFKRCEASHLRIFHTVWRFTLLLNSQCIFHTEWSFMFSYISHCRKLHTFDGIFHTVRRSKLPYILYGVKIHTSIYFVRCEDSYILFCVAEPF